MSMKNAQSYMAALHSTTLRSLIEAVNKAEIKKEDIITILKENETFVLIYYAKGE